MVSRVRAGTLRRGRTSPITSEPSVCSLGARWWKPLAGDWFASSAVPSRPFSAVRRWPEHLALGGSVQVSWSYQLSTRAVLILLCSCGTIVVRGPVFPPVSTVLAWLGMVGSQHLDGTFCSRILARPCAAQLAFCDFLVSVPFSQSR